MASIPCNQYQDLVAKGRTLYAAIVRAVEHHGNTFKPLPQIAPFYYTNVDAPEAPALLAPMSESLANFGHPANNYIFTTVHNSLLGPEIEECPYQLRACRRQSSALHKQLCQPRPAAGAAWANVLVGFDGSLLLSCHSAPRRQLEGPGGDMAGHNR